MRAVHGAVPPGWKHRRLGELLRQVDLRSGDLAASESNSLEVLSLTKRYGLVPQSERFENRVATENVDKYKVVREGWIVYNPYVIWEGAIHSLKRSTPGIVSPVYSVWERIEPDGGYLDILLRSPELIVVYEKLCAGAVNRRRSIKQDDFLDIEVPVPPLSEQQRIAAVLKFIQATLALQLSRIALMDELREAAINQLLKSGCRGGSTVDSALGPVPKSWAVDRLDTFCVLQRGFDITKKQQKKGDVPVVSSGGVASYHDTAMAKGPGVVVGRKGTLGKVHYVESDFWPHDTTLWVNDFKGNDVRFTSYLLKHMRLEQYDSGGSNPTLNRNTVHAQVVAYPTISEQREIADIIAQMDQSIAIHNRKRDLLEELFEVLLHNLMMGKARLIEDTPETAEIASAV